jgi:prevent-host-death family protein
MEIMNIHQAKTNFSQLVDLAAQGKSIVIGKAGKPVAKLVQYAPVRDDQPKPGLYAGQIEMAEDFTAESPLINELMYGVENA